MEMIPTCTLVLLLGVLTCTVMAADKTFSSGNVTVNILGQSGKMKMWTTNSVSHPLTIFLDSITEVDQNGNAVGKSGNPKHSFNSFASQSFSFSSIKDLTLPGTQIKAKSISFDSTLSGLTSRLKFTVFIVGEDGEIQIGNDKFQVKKGQVKFNLFMESWQWCSSSTPCSKNEVGKYLDVDLTVQLGGGQKVTDGGPAGSSKLKKFDFGSGQSMETPRVLLVDGALVEFPANYPKYQMKGSKNTLTFRFPKFVTADYDPLVWAGGAAVWSSAVTIMAAVICSFLLV